MHAQVKPWNEEKFYVFYRKYMIMYGMSQVHSQDSRLTTGPGDLKSIWVLVPVAVRFPGCYTPQPELTLGELGIQAMFSQGLQN